jgi:hypothetical protein
MCNGSPKAGFHAHSPEHTANAGLACTAKACILATALKPPSQETEGESCINCWFANLLTEGTTFSSMDFCKLSVKYLMKNQTVLRILLTLVSGKV